MVWFVTPVAALPAPLALTDTALLGLVALAGFFLLALTGIVVLAIGASAGWWRAPASTAAPSTGAGPTESMPRPRAASRPVTLRGIEIDVPTKHVDSIVNSLRAAGWKVAETGDVVATDEDEEGLTTLSVDLPGSRASGTGEEIR